MLFFQVAVVKKTTTSNVFKNVPSACNASSSSGVHDPLPLTTTGHNTFLQWNIHCSSVFLPPTATTIFFQFLDCLKVKRMEMKKGRNDIKNRVRLKWMEIVLLVEKGIKSFFFCDFRINSKNNRAIKKWIKKTYFMYIHRNFQGITFFFGPCAWFCHSSRRCTMGLFFFVGVCCFSSGWGW